jgi:translation initiation factor IF-3
MENVNDGIRCAEVRAVFPDGTVEVMPTAVAVRRAQAMGLDLVLVAPTAIPPVARAVDYGQWLHDRNHRRDI